MIKTQFIACAGLAVLLASTSPAHAQSSGPTPEESTSGSFVPIPELTYYFDRPAKNMMEELPLGNGRLGMLSDGGLTHQKITLNESSMWSGSKDAEALNPEASKYLSEIRELLFAGKHKEAENLIYKTFVCGGKGSGQGNGAKTPYGSYEVGGFLHLDWSHYIPCSSYKRSLDLNHGESKEIIEVAGKPFRLKTLYSSYVSDVNVINIYNQTPAARQDTLRLSMSRPENGYSSVRDGFITLSGSLPNGRGGQGLSYAIVAKPLLLHGGKLIARGNELLIVDAPVIQILIAHNTNYYNPQLSLVEEGIDQIMTAAGTSPAALECDHRQAFAESMTRVQMRIGNAGSMAEGLPIDQRLAAYHKNPAADPNLASLYMQFGRYLLLSSTRPGALPPNLQGLWTNLVQAPWNSDYHLNINLQMNHWPSEKGNLSESVQPLTSWVEGLGPSGLQTAQTFYKGRGWVTHVLGNVWGFTAPGEHPSWGATNTGAAWLCQHLYNHYLYTQDRAYLERVYPIIKGAAQFFQSTLVKDPNNGYLVNAPTTSPENQFIAPDGSTVAVCAGSTMDNQIIRELFTNTIASARILGEQAFADSLAQLLPQIKPTTIGPDGRIMEWLENYKEVDPHHRHVSHLYGLFPGNEITRERTPELIAAARKSLDARGASSTSWSMAWKINFRARLGDAEKAYEVLNMLLRPVDALDPKSGKPYGSGSNNNLFSSHPPFQIDGNFGGSSGIMEMLLQSETGSITPLPALPKAWKEGMISGLKVVGNATCSLAWDQSRPGKLTQLTLVAHATYSHILTLPKELKDYKLRLNGRLLDVKALTEDGRIHLPLMQPGDRLVLSRR